LTKLTARGGNTNREGCDENAREVGEYKEKEKHARGVSVRDPHKQKK